MKDLPNFMKDLPNLNDLPYISVWGIAIEVVMLVTEPYTDYQLRVRAETGGGYSNYSTLYQAVTDVKGKLDS